MEERVSERDAYRMADEINELAAHISAATCRWLLLVAEFDRVHGYLWFGFPACADWLAWSCSISGSTAREQVRVARSLREFARVRESFGRGELSYSKVRALSRIATAENEEYLMMLATHGTAAQLERVVRNYRGCTAMDLEEANAAHARRNVYWRWEDDGSLTIHGRLGPEEGRVVVQALEAGREILRGEPAAKPGGETSLTPNGHRNVSAETEAPEATAADALALMAETLLADGPRHRSGGSRTELVVHVDAETLASDGAPAKEGGLCHIDEAAGLHPETARRLGCDAGLVRIIEKDGRPLSVGRKRRTVSPALRLALDARDNGCRFPGCTRKLGIDAHHITHWAHGGETKLPNLIQLCGYHHRLVHEGGYTIEPNGAGFRFRRPNGAAVPEVPRPIHGHESRIRRENRTHAPAIGPETCMPLSRGDRLDHGMAVDGLLDADGYFGRRRSEGRAPPG